MTKRGAVWGKAAVPFVVSRVAIVTLTYLTGSIIGNSQSHQTVNCFRSVKSCLLLWNVWDVVHYVSIAHQGYQDVANTAFFPLWPMLIRVVSLPFPHSTAVYVLISLILANFLFYLALVVFYCLLRDLLHDEQIARNALLYLTFAPYAFFFFAGYSESLFLLLCLCVFFCLQRALQTKRRIYWLLAGGAGLLSSLTRSQGIFLLLPYCLVYIQGYLWPWSHHVKLSAWRTLLNREPWRKQFILTTWREKFLALCPILLIPLGLALYMLYLWQTKGNPLAFSGAELLWGRSLALPWMAVWLTIQGIMHANYLQALNLINLTCVIIAVVILALGWKCIPFYYSTFALVSLTFPLLYPWGSINALSSVPRFLLVIFPLYIIVATVKKTRFEQICLVLSVPFLALNTVLFIIYLWVA